MTIITIRAVAKTFRKQQLVRAVITFAAVVLAGSLQAAQNWTYTYNASGQVLTADGPRTDVADVTTYTYDTAGNTATMTNALGQVTQFQNYNGRGQPGTIIDPNGVQTLLTYHARGWLLTSTIKDPGGNAALDLVTSYGYDNVGQVISITLPDNSVLNYEYNGAHQLTAVSNALGERIEYTLDLQGNQIAESIKSSTGTITKTLTRTYDELSRLLQVIGAGGQTTAYQYDTNGNITRVTDGNLNATDQSYDALNRLVSDNAPLNHAVSYNYDAQDNLTQVIDPKGLSTTYTYDGLGNLKQLTSPDTGTTTYTYDSANNQLTQTDANGITATYTYDALNRLTSVSYPNSTLNISYGYDAGLYGKGRLTSMTDASGATVFDYDHRGNLIALATDVGATTYTIDYTYNTVGQLALVTYPSGRIASYTYDSLGRVSQVSTTYDGVTTPLANNLGYLPFGPRTQMDYGNGIQLNSTFDADYRLDLLNHGTVKQTDYSYDNADNIAGILNNTKTAASQSFTYDALNRLTNATGAYGTLGYTYDANGNRLTITDSTGTDTYTYDATSHRLLSSNDWNYSYDANGNRIAKLNTDASGNGLLYSYDDRNRLIEVKDALSNNSLATYTYNASGQRVTKTTPAGTTHYVYGPGGRLMSELSAAGVALRDYLYMNGQPLVVADYTANNATSAEIIVDNGTPEYSTVGNWANSVTVLGFEGSNYQYQAANDAPPNGEVIDNRDAGFAYTDWSSSTANPGYWSTNYRYKAANDAPPGGEVVDNTDSGFSYTGTWPASSTVPGHWGGGYRYHAVNGGTVATWVPSTATGQQEIFARWTSTSSRATDAKYTVYHTGGSTTVTVNQQLNGGTWQSLGIFTIDASSRVELSDASAGTGYVIADAIKFAPPGAGPNIATWTPSVAPGLYDVYGRWSDGGKRVTDAKYTVVHANGTDVVVKDQTANGGSWQLLGTFTIDANSRIEISDQSAETGYLVADAIKLAPPGSVPNTATWSPSAAPGQYEVYAKWTADDKRITDARYTVNHSAGSATTVVNQQLNGGTWQLLGTYALDAASTVVLSDESTGTGYVVVDAIKLVGLNTTPTLTASLYYSHNDHLGTPQVITDQSQAIVWQADYQPFGTVNESVTILANNLRFAGQYFDEESGLHYNYFRDYDPTTGQYIESDPIGLAGGLNTYAYVGGNPLSYVDPFGMDGVYGLTGGNPYSQAATVNRITQSSGVPNKSLGEALSDDCLTICKIDIIVQTIVVDLGIGLIPQVKAGIIVGKAALGTASVASTSLSLADCVIKCKEEKCREN